MMLSGVVGISYISKTKERGEEMHARDAETASRFERDVLSKFDAGPRRDCARLSLGPCSESLSLSCDNNTDLFSLDSIPQNECLIIPPKLANEKFKCTTGASLNKFWRSRGRFGHNPYTNTKLEACAHIDEPSGGGAFAAPREGGGEGQRQRQHHALWETIDLAHTTLMIKLELERMNTTAMQAIRSLDAARRSRQDPYQSLKAYHVALHTHIASLDALSSQGLPPSRRRRPLPPPHLAAVGRLGGGGGDSRHSSSPCRPPLPDVDYSSKMLPDSSDHRGGGGVGELTTTEGRGAAAALLDCPIHEALRCTAKVANDLREAIEEREPLPFYQDQFQQHHTAFVTCLQNFSEAVESLGQQQPQRHVVGGPSLTGAGSSSGPDSSSADSSSGPDSSAADSSSADSSSAADSSAADSSSSGVTTPRHPRTRSRSDSNRLTISTKRRRQQTIV